MKKPCKVLCLFDYQSFTGFSTVSTNVKRELKKHFGNDLQLDICAINYFGEPKEEADGTYVISAVKSAPKKDDFGRFGFLKILKESNEYDGIFIIQDLGVIVPIIKILEHIKTEKKAANQKSFKSMFYFPVDCKLIDKLVEGLEFFDCLVAYTEYGKNEVLRLRPELKTKIKVIPHGNNPKHFYSLPAEEILSFRKEYFGDNAEKFIITNINRNQPRKDIPTTIFAFIEAKKQWAEKGLKNEPFLYLHMNAKDPMGHDLRAILRQTDLIEGKDYMLLDTDTANKGATIEMLNKIYNASDVYLTTTLGEGWGLCVHPLTKILIHNGVVDIKDVKIGDKVLTNNGEYHAVLDTICRKIDSYIHLKTVYGYEIKTTHEHPYYVLSNGKKAWLKADEIKLGDAIGIVKPNGMRRLPDKIDLACYVPNELGWVIEHDYIYHKFAYSSNATEWSYYSIIKKYKTTKKIAENARSYIQGNKKQISKVALSLANKLLTDDFKATEQVKINRFIPVTDSLLELFGWFLADGSTGGGIKVELSFNNTTKDKIAQQAIDIFNDIFGVTDVATRIRGKRVDIIVNNKLLSNFFKVMFGNGAFNKRIPSLFCGCEKSMMPLVKGFFAGDGSINPINDYILFSTVSPSLAYQISSILASNNIFISIKNYGKRIRKSEKDFNSNYDIYKCRIVNHHLQRFFDLIRRPDAFGRNFKRNHKPNFVETEMNFFVPIKLINSVECKDEFYDLCINQSHSFVGNGIVCHNTFTEAAATKTPVIAPLSTSFIEMSDNGKRGYMLETLIPICNMSDNTIRQQCDLYEVADTILYVAQVKAGLLKDLNCERLYDDRIERAYKWSQSLEWGNVCKLWVQYFKETY